ncbi:MAG: hypothetical protein PUF72_06540 [Clostridiales bacterium]|nr:hypothetical protein [Clostridiales bacterium]
MLNAEKQQNSENTVLPNESKRDTISTDNNEKGEVENADIRGDREETPQRSQADGSGNDTSDSLPILERQAGKGTGEVQEGTDRADNEQSESDGGGQTDIERRTLKDVCRLKEFEKLKNTFDNELTTTASNELWGKYKNDPRINGDDDIVYDASDVCVYDMLTNADNELRELFSDNVAEYFNTDKDSSKDITGQAVPEHILESTQNSVVKNENGQLIPVYHGTGENFDSFKRSDIGIHFGSYAQAVQRVNDKGIENPRYVKAYLNITNPIEIDEDFFGWNAFQIVQKLAKIGVIEQSEGVGYLTNSKENLEKSNDELCALLKSKGYDGIVYNNRVEAAQGRSYIVFDNSQVFETDGKNETAVPSAPAKQDNISDYVGTQPDVDGRSFIVDSIDEDYGRVSLMDITFKNHAGFPVFRSESIEWLKNVLDIQDSAKNAVNEENIKEEQDDVRREVLDGENGGYDERDISQSVPQTEEVGRASRTDRNDSTLGDEGVREHDGLGKREQTAAGQHAGGNIDNELGKSDPGKRSGTGENEPSSDVTGVNNTLEEEQKPPKKAQKNNTRIMSCQTILTQYAPMRRIILRL